MADQTTSKRSSNSFFWLLGLFIVIETQYIINGWVTGYGNNQTIVNYVSFAGTIVSIILAVLAIVYSYYQNFAQQRDSTTIATQILELRRLVEHADQSSTEFSGELVRLQDISNKLDTNIELVKGSQATIGKLSEKLDALKEEKIESGTTATSLNSPDLDKIAETLVNAAIPTQIMLYRIVRAGVEKKLEFDEIVASIIKPCIKLPVLNEWIVGNFNAVCYILLDLKIIRIAVNNRNFKLDSSLPSFNIAIENAFVALTGTTEISEPFFDHAKLKTLIESVDK